MCQRECYWMNWIRFLWDQLFWGLNGLRRSENAGHGGLHGFVRADQEEGSHGACCEFERQHRPMYLLSWRFFVLRILAGKKGLQRCGEILDVYGLGGKGRVRRIRLSATVDYAAFRAFGRDAEQVVVFCAFMKALRTDNTASSGLLANRAGLCRLVGHGCDQQGDDLLSRLV